MIKKLKLKFVALAMTVLFVLLSVIMAGMTVLNYNSVISSADEILDILAQNRGVFPGTLGFLSPEIKYSSRYFSVYLTKSGYVINTDTQNIAAVDAVTAIEYAGTVIEKGNLRGFVDSYRYVVSSEKYGLRIVFLDCQSRLESFKTFTYTSFLIILGAYIAVFAVVFFFAGRIVKPVAESYEKQKRFITDAGHEIKTPLTIISANADILEMELGEGNECINDIKSQTIRLRSLTDELVMLTRMEESDTKLTKIDFPVSEVVSEAAHPFGAVAANKNKTFSVSVEPLLTLNGDAKSVGQLVSVFLDNAMKYSPDGGEISLSLSKQSKNIVLSVRNTTSGDIDRKQLSHIFDRFYRADASRNSQTGGYGIGLSVAKAIVSAHDGKIFADITDDKMFVITASFPL